MMLLHAFDSAVGMASPTKLVKRKVAKRVVSIRFFFFYFGMVAVCAHQQKRMSHKHRGVGG